MYIGFAGVGEYFGWWDRFLKANEKDGAQLYVDQVQLEDEKSWIKWAFKGIDRSVATSKSMVDEHFVGSLPVGMQHYINDPK